MDYLDRGLGSGENNNNLLDKLQDAIGRGQNLISILPSSFIEPEIITISDPDVGISGVFDVILFLRLPVVYIDIFYKEKKAFQSEIIILILSFSLVL